MSITVSIIVLLGLLLLLLFAGVHVASALGLVGVLGAAFLIPTAPYHMVGKLGFGAVNKFTLTSVPMFILMGELLVNARLSESLYGTVSLWLKNFRGGLCHATTTSCAVFAAMSGSSLATSATIGLMASEEMIKRGYEKKLTYGTIAAGGTIGILIPPSIPMIIYGNVAGVSIGHCFIAGIIPGIIIVVLFIILVYLWGRFSPGSIPAVDRSSNVPLKDKLIALYKLTPALTIIFMVLGGIYLGVTTPTESGAIGAFGALTLCLIRRTLSWRDLWKVLLSTVKTTSFIMLILCGAGMVSFVVQYLRVPQQLADWVVQSGFSPYIVLSFFYLLYLILGMFVDPTSMLVMTVPAILPATIQLGFDPIWLGVMLTILCEIGLITPPVGLNLYILQGVTGCTLSEVSRGSVPFIITLLVGLLLFTAFPRLSLWLPGLM